MSSFLSKLFTSIGIWKKKVTVLVLGLDNSGKTTIIHWLKLDKAPEQETVATVGFNVETFSRAKLNFTVFDMSGQNRYRSIWEHYYADAEAVIFVIDSSDTTRSSVARDELQTMLGHPKMRRPLPILFLANKMDLDVVMTAAECSDALDLQLIKDKPWQICECSALTGKGINEGLDWLSGTNLEST